MAVHLLCRIRLIRIWRFLSRGGNGRNRGGWLYLSKFGLAQLRCRRGFANTGEDIKDQIDDRQDPVTKLISPTKKPHSVDLGNLTRQQHLDQRTQPKLRRSHELDRRNRQRCRVCQPPGLLHMPSPQARRLLRDCRERERRCGRIGEAPKTGTRGRHCKLQDSKRSGEVNH